MPRASKEEEGMGTKTPPEPLDYDDAPKDMVYEATGSQGDEEMEDANGSERGGEPGETVGDEDQLEAQQQELNAADIPRQTEIDGHMEKVRGLLGEVIASTEEFFDKIDKHVQRKALAAQTGKEQEASLRSANQRAHTLLGTLAHGLTDAAKAIGENFRGEAEADEGSGDAD